MASDTIQMNTRISRTLKENGDEALERAGYSPSQAVRKLWDFAARNLHNPQAIQSLLDATEAPAESEVEKERARRREISFKGAQLCKEAYERHGIEPSDFTKHASYDELRELSLFERLRERGLDA